MSELQQREAASIERIYRQAFKAVRPFWSDGPEVNNATYIAETQELGPDQLVAIGMVVKHGLTSRDVYKLAELLGRITR